MGRATSSLAMQWATLMCLTSCPMWEPRGGRRDRTLYADSPPPWKLAGKCRTMGAEGALRKFCLT